MNQSQGLHRAKAFPNRGAPPWAWQLVGAFTGDIMERETTFAVGVQQISEALALEFPETRHLASAGISIFYHNTLAFEHLHDEDYSVGDGGTGRARMGDKREFPRIRSLQG